jgi:uncharacterized membrane protein
MHKGRLEAFSDGVVAILITIMVLELRPPVGTDLSALRALAPVFSAYVLSFVYIGIYWSNHHHMLQAARSISGGALWANLHLLFWLSLIPFATAWMGQNPEARGPALLYAVLLFMAAVAYTILARALVRHDGPGSALARALGRDVKGWVSLALYALAFVLAYAGQVRLAQALFALVALMWLVPDRRIERTLAHSAAPPPT